MKKIYKDIIAVLLLAIIPLVFLSNLFLPNTMVGGGDLLIQGYPFKYASVEMLKEGKMPLWLPYINSGVPLLVGGQVDPVIYPPNLIFNLLKVPAHLQTNYNFILHIFLAGFFMYLLMMQIISDRFAAFFSAVAFMFTGHIITLINAGHVLNICAMVWTPFLFFCLERGIVKKQYIYFLIGGVGFGFQMLTGGMQYIYYIMLALSVYFIYRMFLLWKQEKNTKQIAKFTLLFIIFVIIGCALSAVQFIPFYEYYTQSHRVGTGYEFASSFSTPPEELLSYIIPGLFGLKDQTYWGRNGWETSRFPVQHSDYIGISTLILAILSILFVKDYKIHIRFFITLAIASLILACGGFTPLYKLVYYLPLFGSFRNSRRFLILFSFSASLLAGLSLSGLFEFVKSKFEKKLSKSKKNIIEETNINRLKQLKTGLFVTVGIVLFVGVISYANLDNFVEFIKSKIPGGILDKQLRDEIALKSFKFTIVMIGLSATLIFLLLKKIKSNFAKILFSCLIIFDLWSLNSSFVNTSDPRKLINKDYVIDFLQHDKDVFRIFAIDRNSGYMSNHWMFHKIQSITGYHGVPLKCPTELLSELGTNSFLLWDMLNVKYILASNKLDHPLLKLEQDGNIKIYRYINSWPRAYMVNNIKVIKDKSSIFAEMKSGNFNPRTQVILEEEPKEFVANSNQSTSQVYITKYEANEIELKANIKNDGYMVLSEVYFPGWKAYVDEKETKIYKANYALRSIALKSGEHIIKFKYEPFSVKIGMYISVITSIIIILIIGIILIWEKTSRNIK
ncbi:MAG: YfhO family protein [Candidatus Firestonebacteria bacterium]